MSNKALMAALVLVATSLAACASGSPSPRPLSSGATSVPPPSSQSTGTSTTQPVTSSTLGVAGCASAVGCAQALYNDWSDGNQTKATQVASAQAVAQMFAHHYGQMHTSGGPVGPYQSGPNCTGRSPVVCTWIGQDQRLDMTVSPAARGFLVTQVKRNGG